MKLFLLLLFPTTVLFLCEGANIEIINGKEVVPHSRPYMALIETPKGNSTSFCGGSLIKPDWVLTAAHCELIARKTIVTLGAHSKKCDESEKQKFRAIKLFKHKLFNPKTLENDIQLVKLSRKAQIGKAVKTLHLPVTFEDPKEGTVCSISGWGKTEKGALSDKLLETNITIRDRGKCKTFWKGKHPITTGMLCAIVGANHKSACRGDSGGPLICDGVFRGLSSFGTPLCGTPGAPNVFTRLTKEYVDYIKQTIRKNSNEMKSVEN